MLVLSYTILYVRDVLDTIDFYEKAFGLRCNFTTPQNDYGEMYTGGHTLAFASHQLGKANFKQGFQASKPDELPLGMELAFTTFQLEEDFQKALDAGAVLVEAITEKPWGQKVGYVRDPDGFLIELCTPMPLA